MPTTLGATPADPPAADLPATGLGVAVTVAAPPDPPLLAPVERAVPVLPEFVALDWASLAAPELAAEEDRPAGGGLSVRASAELAAGTPSALARRVAASGTSPRSPTGAVGAPGTALSALESSAGPANL
ncbi:MAG TPA: hypothetical protein VMZ73_09695, partial [Acidimicrobiales bacterium]|nr:hypothetical protein [Acidimicrobiales bacterium]